MKTCRKCRRDYSTNRPRCPECARKYQKAYRTKNRERLREQKKTWYQENSESIKKRTAQWYWDNWEKSQKDKRQYYLRNKDAVQEYHRNWQKGQRKSVEFRLKRALRRRVWDMLRKGTYQGRKKAGSAIRDLGCSPTELMEHLESQFTPEMTWENYGTYWSVDHTIPLSSFDLTNREQFLKAAHYTNLQPLTIPENASKGNRTK